ncbi:DinB family protein [Fictibacillus phosphorivorans]|uniref:DinB family protein n=1 Tax=Fictibacillus phosphorivorans TaxID=1221500 RepID=UPI00203AFAA1|nr:DinB family protein [Fictibacillus phosphorivorans]MCM3719421.1 DinB family protein [Fictibacillus phosphorivorans]MCM3777101.1 DinB family protein [Fictibacillus phosphorivorans]
MSEVLTNYENFTNWLQQLKRVPQEYWLMPIKEGKWSVGEIVAHIKAWDVFVWDERVSYFMSGSEIPPKKVDVEEINSNAAYEARSGISKDQLLDEVIECRQVVSDKLGKVPNTVWQEKIEMGSKMITLCEYISGLVKHDEHHKKQIEEFLHLKGIDVLKQEV